jgi:hypothetical protein
MSEVAISCPSCGSRLEVRVRTAPPPAREQRWRARLVSWWCRPVDIDRPEPPKREIDLWKGLLGSGSIEPDSSTPRGSSR